MQERNLIFCFSGTGNSLHLSKEIAKELPGCEIVRIDKDTSFEITEKYERIGIVYPTYFIGLPLLLQKKIEKIDFSKSDDSYFFAVASYGGTVGNGVRAMKKELEKKSLRLNYGQKLKMFSNYLILYEMKENVAAITHTTDKNMQTIVEDIVEKTSNRTKSPNPIFEAYSKMQAKKTPLLAKRFVVDDACNSCGTCRRVCPAKNIEMTGGKPAFGMSCEQCLACIQLCPQTAINYENKTQSRGRYHHPSIALSELLRED